MSRSSETFSTLLLFDAWQHRVRNLSTSLRTRLRAAADVGYTPLPLDSGPTSSSEDDTQEEPLVGTLVPGPARTSSSSAPSAANTNAFASSSNISWDYAEDHISSNPSSSRSPKDSTKQVSVVYQDIIRVVCGFIGYGTSNVGNRS